VPTGVLLVEDHAVVRDGIKALLERHDEYIIAGESTTATEAIEACQRLLPDMVILDIQLPGVSGLEIIPELQKASPGTRILVLSASEDRFSVIAAIQAGARGYVPKGATANELLIAVRTVLNGGTYLSPTASAHLMDRLQRGRNETALEPDAIAKLTPRERQIVRMIAEGHSTKEIAVVLNLGVNTIRSYRKNLMAKLGLSSAVALTRWALSHGLAQPPKSNAASA
jgi:DNA-binding NarL/FixJ family response regulator